MTGFSAEAACRLSLYEKAQPDGTPLEEKLYHAKEAGFDCFELSIDESGGRLARLEWSVADRTALRSAAEREGMPVASICLSGHRRYPLGSADPAVARRGMEILQKAVELAGDLGVRLIQLAGYDVYYEPSTPETAARFGENLARGVEWAAAAGVTLGFETMECVSPAGAPILDTVAKAMGFVKRIQSPWLQIYPDVGNVTNACGGDTAAVLRDLEAGRGHIAAAHLKETVQGVFRDRFPGEGRVDFPAVIRALKEQGVRWFTAECWAREGDDWKARLKAVEKAYRPLIRKGD